jgi:regulator of RNase E activity RraA
MIEDIARTIALVAVTMCLAGAATAQEPDYRAGHNFLHTAIFSAEEDAELLEVFEGLRVADVSDGMDFVGLVHTGRMDPAIHAAWRDTEHFRHRFVGIAVTVRYVPTQEPAPAGDLDYEEFRAREGSWYNERSPEPFTALLRAGSVVVIDEAPNADVGSIGSFNILAWQLAGAVGVVTDGTARDIDEVATQQVPLYFREPGRGIRPWRNEVESVNRPVVVGGALVRPGDVIVADGDGVVVVPRRHARSVADFAHRILDADKAGRRSLYEKSGREADDSVR